MEDESNQPTEHYRLVISKTNEDPAARVVFQQDDGTRVDSLRLPGLSEGGSADEKTRILTEISTALLADRLTYGVEESEANNPGEEFFVTLSLIDRLELPIEPPGNSLRSVQVILISQDSFTVNDTDSGPLVAQTAFQDYETLYGLLRDRPDGVTEKTAGTDDADDTDSTSDNASLFPKGNRLAALDYIRPFHLPERFETYRTASGQIMEPQLFNTFIKSHPGLEHLGGVPKGGTFVLTYADNSALAASLLALHRSANHRRRIADVEEEAILPTGIPGELEQVANEFGDWKNIVVADYCLPYRLNSQIVQSPSGHPYLDLDPIVLLKKTNFCADDDTLYEFILYPPNGQLKGEGSFFANGKYCFQPSRVYPNLQHDVAIAFTYAVDGCESSLIVTINPLPDASFQVGKWNKTVFCANDEAISLIPCIPGGTFKAFAGDEKIDISAQVLGDNLFLPEQVVLAGANQLKITLQYTVENEQKNCSNSHTETITVHALPAVDFQIGSEEEDITRVCADVAFVPLNPEPANGLFRVLDGNHDISSSLLQGNRIFPSAANLGELATKTITVEYSITDERGCQNTITKPLEILALPDAGFRIGEGEGTFCQNHGPVPLIPNGVGGIFRAVTDDANDLSNTVLEPANNPTRFLPEAVPLNNQQRVRITLIYTIRNSNDCEQRSQQTIIVVALPDAEFQVGESNNTDFFNDDPSVPLISHMYGGQFSAFDGDSEITADVIAQKPHRFLPAAVDMDALDSKEITLKYQLTLDGCGNESEKIVTIQVRPEEPEEPEEDDENPPDPDDDPDTPGDSGDSGNFDNPEDPGDPPGGTDILENPSPINIPIVTELFPSDLLGEPRPGDNPIAEDMVGNDITFPDPIDLGSASPATESPIGESSPEESAPAPPLSSIGDEPFFPAPNSVPIDLSVNSVPAPEARSEDPLPEEEPLPTTTDQAPPTASNPFAGFDLPGGPPPRVNQPSRRSEPEDVISLIRELRNSFASLPPNEDTESDGEDGEPEAAGVDSELDESIVDRTSDETSDGTPNPADGSPDDSRRDNTHQIVVEAAATTAPDEAPADANQSPDSGKTSLGRRLLGWGPSDMIWTTTVGAIATVIVLVWAGTAVNNRTITPVNAISPSSQ